MPALHQHQSLRYTMTVATLKWKQGQVASSRRRRKDYKSNSRGTTSSLGNRYNNNNNLFIKLIFFFMQFLIASFESNRIAAKARSLAFTIKQKKMRKSFSHRLNYGNLMCTVYTSAAQQHANWKLINGVHTKKLY